MPVTADTPPTAATMPLDGGHVALDFVNTVYGQVGGPVEADVLTVPEDLVTFARRVGVAGAGTPAAPSALAAALALRDVVDAVLRAQLARDAPPPAALAALEDALHRAHAAAHLVARGAGYAWTWPEDDARSPVHAFARAAAELLADPDELARVHVCAGCCWLFVDHSRGAGRRWCSMADCGTEAKKRRYVERRRQRRDAG